MPRKHQQKKFTIVALVITLLALLIILIHDVEAAPLQSAATTTPQTPIQ